MRSPQTKILSLTQAIAWRRALRCHGDALIVTNGCFDVLTPGHVAFLDACRSLERNAALLVLLNSDASVRALKGPTRPIWDQTERAFVLASLCMVSAVVIFENPRCDAELETLAPDIYAKGGDYTLDTLYATERCSLAICGARIQFIPRDPRYSSTSLIERLRNDAEVAAASHTAGHATPTAAATSAPLQQPQ